jgi:hypothetical protein
MNRLEEIERFERRLTVPAVFAIRGELTARPVPCDC